MNSRENQGLQIATIVFLILTIVMSITTFMFFKQWKEADRQLKDAVQTASKAEASLREIADEQITLMKWIAGEDPSLADRTKNHKALMNEWSENFHRDMAASAQTFPAEKQNYRLALAEWAGLLDVKQAERDLADEARKLAEAAAVEKEQEMTVALAKKAAEIQKVKEELLAAKAEFNKALAGYKTIQVALTKEKEAKDAQIVEIKEAARIAAESSTKQLLEVTLGRNALRDELIKLTTQNFEVADGQVAHVNQQSHTVWINLGNADALQRQVNFSVYAGDPQVKTDLHLKGKIEVVQLLGDHLAEARILQDDLSNPVQPGDKIFSPLWHFGRRERFAIAGVIDVNGDGISDLDFVRNLIAHAGGTVDSYLDAAGKPHGVVSQETRYLIRGAPPVNGLGEYKNMLTAAKDLGVHTLSAVEFLDHIGWKDTRQVARAPDGGVPTSRGTVSDVFKSRRPPTASEGNAY